MERGNYFILYVISAIWRITTSGSLLTFTNEILKIIFKEYPDSLL